MGEIWYPFHPRGISRRWGVFLRWHLLSFSFHFLPMVFDGRVDFFDVVLDLVFRRLNALGCHWDTLIEGPFSDFPHPGFDFWDDGIVSALEFGHTVCVSISKCGSESVGTFIGYQNIDHSSTENCSTDVGIR